LAVASTVADAESAALDTAVLVVDAESDAEPLSAAFVAAIFIAVAASVPEDVSAASEAASLVAVDVSELDVVSVEEVGLSLLPTTETSAEDVRFALASAVFTAEAATVAAALRLADAGNSAVSSAGAATTDVDFVIGASTLAR